MDGRDKPGHDDSNKARVISMTAFRKFYDRVLEIIAVILMIAVTGIVTLGVIYRWLGASLVWYLSLIHI